MSIKHIILVIFIAVLSGCLEQEQSYDAEVIAVDMLAKMPSTSPLYQEVKDMCLRDRNEGVENSAACKAEKLAMDIHLNDVQKIREEKQKEKQNNSKPGDSFNF